jgi:pSer/pThr/pTyr-binding forkhead associated (FHA) protein
MQQAPMQQAPMQQAPMQQAQQAPEMGARAPLFLLFNGQRYRIDKDKFVIGRGSQQTDLTIRDGNISRKHCMVMFRAGNYYIKDLESTNGIEFNGKRIEQKRVEEGDTYYLCDYELRFTFR